MSEDADEEPPTEPDQEAEPFLEPEPGLGPEEIEELTSTPDLDKLLDADGVSGITGVVMGGR